MSTHFNITAAFCSLTKHFCTFHGKGSFCAGKTFSSVRDFVVKFSVLSGETPVLLCDLLR